MAASRPELTTNKCSATINTTMKVREVMQTEIVTIPESATYREAAEILHTHTISGAPVVGEDDGLVGILSEKDLFRMLYPHYSSYYENPESYTDAKKQEMSVHEVKDANIKEFITRDVHTADPDQEVMHVGGLLLAKKIHRMPVVDKEELAGIISRRDIYKKIFAEHLGLE